MIVEKDNNFIIPDEFNKEFFIRILENGLKIKEPELSKISLSMGSTGGENYCSKIYRIRIEFHHSNPKTTETECVSVIIKYMADSLTTELNQQFYNNELKIYLEVLPHMENLFHDNLKFGPKCYYHSEEHIPLLVMEDLGSLNFNVADRILGMSELQAKVALKKLAKFHAGSMVLVEKDPQIFNNFSWYIFQSREDQNLKNLKVRNDMFYGNVKHIIEVFQKFPEFQSIIEKLKNFSLEKLFKLVEKVLCRPDAIKVLNHGDSWVNNILIRNGNEFQSTEAIFVDFQLTYYGSLGLDLQYFFNTSLQVDQHKNRDQLIQFYCENLQETLKELNYVGSVPTIDEVRREIYTCEIVGFMAAEVILVLISIDRNESKENTFKTFFEKDKIRQQLLNVLSSNERVIEILKTTMKRCDDLKLFD